MHNMVYLIGRIVDMKDSKILVRVQRSFKNKEGIYESDDIIVRVFNNIKNQVVEYCKKGDLLGIKGRLEVIDNTMYVVAEKVSFLASKKAEEENEK